MNHLLASIVMISLFVSLAPLPGLTKVPPEATHLITQMQTFNKSAKKEDLRKALRPAQDLLALAERNGNEGLKAFALLMLGGFHSRLGEYREALPYLENGVALTRRTKDLMQERLALVLLGATHERLGDNLVALQDYTRLLEIARKRNLRKEEISALHSMGRVSKSLGQYGRAIVHFNQALNMSRDSNDSKDMQGILESLGWLYHGWGQYNKTVEYWEESLAVSRRIGDLRGEGRTLINLGRVHIHRGNWDQALKNYDQGAAIYSRLKMSTATPKELIGHLYLDVGDLAKAEPFLKEANRGASLGRFYLAKAEFDQAKHQYQRVLKSAQQRNSKEGLFTAYTGLGACSEGLKHYESAAGAYQQAVKLVEDLRSRLSADERERFFDVTVNAFFRTAPYEGLARCMIQLDRPGEAWKSTEHTKARVFAEAISKRSGYTARDVPKEIREKDSAIANGLATLSEDLHRAYEKGNKELVESLEPQVKQAKDKYAVHVATLRKQYPLFAATKYPEPMDLSQTAVKDNELVLSYDVSDPGLITYLTKGKELKKALFKPVPKKEIDELVRRFRAPLEVQEITEEKLKSFDFAAGKKLADILLSDMLPELPRGAPLIIVPADCLGVLPFEMLTVNDGGKVEIQEGKFTTPGAQFFGDRNPISYYQSVTALTLARTLGKQKDEGKKLLVMADPIFQPNDPRFIKDARDKRIEQLNKLTEDLVMSAKTQNNVTWPRLPRTRELGESLQKTYPGVTDLKTGASATKSWFMHADLTPYRSLVFATHGYAGNDLGGLKEPVLVLTLVNQPPGTDGFLRMSEVMGLKLNADVVALTACQTGLGRRISGEGTVGMGRAFQYAGAKSAIMSLWSVSEKSSVQLVESFFKHLKEGKNKLEALKLARDEIRKAGYDHPFFWAPFILVGEVN